MGDGTADGAATAAEATAAAADAGARAVDDSDSGSDDDDDSYDNGGVSGCKSGHGSKEAIAEYGAHLNVSITESDINQSLEFILNKC